MAQSTTGCTSPFTSRRFSGDGHCPPSQPGRVAAPEGFPQLRPWGRTLVSCFRTSPFCFPCQPLQQGWYLSSCQWTACFQVGRERLHLKGLLITWSWSTFFCRLAIKPNVRSVQEYHSTGSYAAEIMSAWRTEAAGSPQHHTLPKAGTCRRHPHGNISHGLRLPFECFSSQFCETRSFRTSHYSWCPST